MALIQAPSFPYLRVSKMFSPFLPPKCITQPVANQCYRVGWGRWGTFFLGVQRAQKNNYPLLYSKG